LQGHGVDDDVALFEFEVGDFEKVPGEIWTDREGFRWFVIGFDVVEVEGVVSCVEDVVFGFGVFPR
jgi:hypothetical protein